MSMLPSVILLFFLLWNFQCLFILTKSIAVQPYEPAPNCACIECPAYTVIYTNEDFEIRSYKIAKWVSSPRVVADNFTSAVEKSFRTLFDYYGGKNKHQVKIEMTAPVLVDVEENSSYVVFFYVPEKYQKKIIPSPLTDEIKEGMFPKRKYTAVRRFDGYLSSKRNENELSALKNSLTGTPYQRAVNEKVYSAAGYNSPFELRNRVNEVGLWFD